MDEDLRRGLLHLSTAVLDATERAGALVEPTVTATQLRVLAHLGRQADGPTGPGGSGGPGSAGSTVSALAEALGVAVSTASRLADRLGAAGLTARQDASDNRREVVVVLTRRGREVLGRWLEARAAAMVELLATVDEVDREPVARVLRRLGTGAPVLGPSAPAGREAGLRLQRAVLDADPDLAPQVLAEQVAELTGASAVVLQVLSQDCRYLVPVAAWPRAVPARLGTPAPHREAVERGPAGTALREGRVVVEAAHGQLEPAQVHVPVGGGARTGVLTVHTATPEVPSETVDLVAGLAELAGPVLATAVTGSRRTELAARTHEWTVSAEVQARQLGPRHLRAHGVEVACHLEPAWDGATDAYDSEVLPATGSTGACVDVALLDCRTTRRLAPALTALALGALRHARTLGLPLSQQARLVDEAVYGHHRGQGTVDVLLLRVHLQPWRVEALATTDMRIFLQRGSGPQHLDVPEHEALGATGDSSYSATDLPVVRGDRLLLLGDGFAVPGADSTRAEVVASRARDHDPQEVVRQVVADLLERSGHDGPIQDATLVCVDLADRIGGTRQA